MAILSEFDKGTTALFEMQHFANVQLIVGLGSDGVRILQQKRVEILQYLTLFVLLIQETEYAGRVSCLRCLKVKLRALEDLQDVSVLEVIQETHCLCKFCSGLHWQLEELQSLLLDEII